MESALAGGGDGITSDTTCGDTISGVGGSPDFRGLLLGDEPGKPDRWLDDPRHSRVRSMQQFARTLSRGIETVRNAIAEPWSSGQAEGQINRLKTLKRAMYGRAGIELLRARMLPFETSRVHIK